MTVLSKVDWDMVEPHYRAGVRTLADMAREVGVCHTAIVKHAKKRGWERAGRPRREVIPKAAPRDNPGFVYVIYMVTAEVGRICKIGMSVSFDNRLKNLQSSSPFEIRVACCYFVADMRGEETLLHEKYAKKRVRGEWFLLSDEDLREIAAGALRL